MRCGRIMRERYEEGEREGRRERQRAAFFRRCPIHACSSKPTSGQASEPYFPYDWILRAHALTHLEKSHPDLFSEGFYANEWLVFGIL